MKYVETNNFKIKLFFLFAVIFFSFKIYKIPDIPAIELNPESVNYYQENQCTFTIFDLIDNVNKGYNFEIKSEPRGPIECFGLVSWVEYQPPKLVENGWDKNEPDKILIWVSKNLHLNLFLQSLFWLVLISFIPKSNNFKFKFKPYYILLTTLLFYFHLFAEKNYYEYFFRDLDIEIYSYEFNGDLYIQNFYLYGYLLSIFIILYFFTELISSRLNNLVNYLPYIFLLYGTYNALNLSFYVIIFTFFGVVYLFTKKINYKFLLIYLFFCFVWILNFSENNILFDVDKLRGFINSSQTMPSLIYWMFIFYLFTLGIYFVIDNGLKNFDLQLFLSNLLTSGSLIFLFGLISGYSKLFNFFSDYFLGLNKYPMRTLESIEGNTWRGIAPSAEGMGEFFALTLLCVLILFTSKIIKISKVEIILILIILIGLLRTNNFAALSSFVLLGLTYWFYIKYKNIKIIFLSFFALITFFSFIYINNYQQFSYQYLSSAVIYEGVQATEMSYNFIENQYGQTDQKLGNYRLILELPEEETNLSTSLRTVIKNYDLSNSNNNIPSLNSLINMSAYFINRAEKWGIFLAKYDPTLIEFIFGYGPQQFSEYYFGHGSKYNFGLFLPHSSFLNYLIFFGFLGLILIFIFVFNFLIKSKYLISKYLLIFLLLNFLKSDALLYLPNLVFLIVVLNLEKLISNNIEISKH